MLNALIGNKTRIENGCLQFEEGIHIDGFVGVNILGIGDKDTAVSVSEDGEVTGNIQADTVRVAGTVRGNITASGHVELLATVRVAGHIECRSLEQADGAIVQGSTRTIP